MRMQLPLGSDQSPRGNDGWCARQGRSRNDGWCAASPLASDRAFRRF